MEVNEKSDLVYSMLPVIKELKEEKKHSAVHTYTATLNSFTAFFDGKGDVMPTEQVFTPGILKEYQDWMRQKGASWNTVSTYMRVLRAVYNRLFTPGSAEHNPNLFGGVYTKVESKVKRALTEEQMQTLSKANFDLLPEDIKCVLAWFLLMFMFRGMPFIDLAHLRKSDVKGKMIVYCRHKTGKQIEVGIPREAMRLFEEFRNKNPASPYLFPILSRELRNEWQLYRCYLEALRNFNRKLVKIGKLLLPGVKISSYTARHTWATLSFYMGTPLGIISQALGHSSVRVTETYLKPFGNKKMDDANNQLLQRIISPEAGYAMYNAIG
ncbi:phage integrase SAM-like domain-containing protein [uncultured Parabacteroides sp.]|uniref:tyrosine-type recombinase/integrase n=1 Tax=uncultured Parabacteroides sp. TaxID=512312 RepID=UPI0025F96C2B|nr:phage integrase SAM-like domain-containing protein [uncultured Parabacteroides sp.]